MPKPEQRNPDDLTRLGVKLGRIPEYKDEPADIDRSPVTKRQWAKFFCDIGRQGFKIHGDGMLVYTALLSHAFGTREVWPSHDRLCQLTGLSVSTVKRALKRLRSIGLIAPAPKRGKTNVYRLL